MLIALDRDGTPFIISRAGIDALWRGVVRSIAVTNELEIRRLSRNQLRCKKVKGCLHLAQVDMLPLAGSSFVIKGCEEGRRQEAWGDGVGVGIPRSHGVAIRPAGQFEEAGDSCGVISVSGHGSAAPGLAHQACADHDDAGFAARAAG